MFQKAYFPVTKPTFNMLSKKLFRYRKINAMLVFKSYGKIIFIIQGTQLITKFYFSNNQNSH